MVKRNAKVIIVGIFLFIWQSAFSQLDLSYYLPEIDLDAAIPTPESVLQYQVGEWHVSHDQLVHYVSTVCAKSNRCSLTEYARSHENRPLVYLTISHPDNMDQLENIRQKHNQLVYGPDVKDSEIDNIPIIIYQGYSIHGDESSGANASMLMAYYLLAGNSDHLDQLLKESVILLDPCYNPDGLHRFSTWANMHKHKNLNPDPASREFHEVWPSGRTNHYWFDLNRDWLFNIHPESKGRIEVFHKWKPDILTDHHEMGSNSTFFFQPGIPSRTNPNTPAINQEITEKIGHYHASFLDSIGSSYYSKESFDDYYYGKGSSYPDINGCIGILFEQASSLGHLQETRNGLLSFPFTIRNQVVTSLSTQKASMALKSEILKYKRDFYSASRRKHLKGAYVFQCSDNYKARFFVDMLNRHDIRVFMLSQNVTLEGHQYSSADSYLVPKDQPQYELAKSMFEKVHEFPDSLFYDVSTWTIPLALDIRYCDTQQKLSYDAESPVTNVPMKVNNIEFKSSHYAVIAEWKDYMAPALLHSLLSKNLEVKVLEEPSRLHVEGKSISFDRGSLVIPLWSQKDFTRQELFEFIKSEANRFEVGIVAVETGFSPEGKSLGSPKASQLNPLNVAMIVGQGINAYEAGDCWYQLDFRYGIPVSHLDIHNNPRINLDRYNVIILPDGHYDVDSRFENKLKAWLSNGGTLIAMRRAINFTNNLKLSEANSIIDNSNSDRQPRAYDGHTHHSGAQVIGGAIFETSIDLSHPLFFGYSQNTLAVFKRGTQFYDLATNNYATPMRYTDSPRMSGYCSAQNLEKAKGSAAVMVYRHGAGKVVAMVDNPNFRAYWLGGSRMFANALFFSRLISNSTAQE